jgi:twitching motility protein PilT
MSNINSLLEFMQSSLADQLRLGTGKPPQMLAHGVPKRLTIAATDDDTLRFLLAGILTPEREHIMRVQGQVETTYDAGRLGRYRVQFRARTNQDGFDALISAETRSGAALPGGSPAEAVQPPAAVEAERPAVEVVRREAEPPPEPPSGTAPPLALLALLRIAAGMRASDIHLAQGTEPRLRVDGSLRVAPDAGPVDVLELFPMDDSARASLARGSSVEFSVSDPAGGSARVHVYPTADGVAAAIRLLPPHAPSLESLHLPVPLDDLVHLPHGLVLICGASGSGKSTTLAGLAQAALDKRSIVLVTLEDPIEYTLVAGRASLVRRRQVGRDVTSFVAGLRDALRENPDILLVGELRDAEAIQLAMTAAETGHLVLATLHSRSAASAITRLVDAYPPAQQEQARRQMADSLRAVVAQRLLPRARTLGRVPALEVLRVNPAAASLIREGKTSQLATVMQSARSEGMLLLERCLADQVRDGVITLEAARAAANDPASLGLQLGGSPMR